MFTLDVAAPRTRQGWSGRMAACIGCAYALKSG
ncbi:Uncharacterised protein [Brevibacterium casei]|uniref:Uncharacterized protein n=1 Tax=Brevibacterium casei TaxID=33889 RepID=A0A449DAF7_9MICO|nr:Uncharacterised protein [Brevibacterium casei]